MKKVFKYPVGLDSFELDMPQWATILSLHMQNGKPHIWALVDPDLQITRRRFLLVGTGHDVPENAKFVGTFLVRGDALVFHLFEV